MGYLIADFHSNLNRWKNYFCHILNVLGIDYVRLTEIHTAELLVSKFLLYRLSLNSWKGGMYSSPDTDHIPTEFIQTVGGTCSEIHCLINCIWNMKKVPWNWKESHMVFCRFIKWVIKLSVLIIKSISLFSSSYQILSNILLSRLTSYVDGIIGIVSVDFDTIHQLQIRYFAFIRYWRTNLSTVRLYIIYLWTPRKPLIQLAFLLNL